jgi:hypothetical protein
MVLGSLITVVLHAQPVFSIGTDVSLLRNMSPDQHFFAIGQTVKGEIHFTKKESGYAWISYYTNGNLRNRATATANDSTTQPAVMNYTVYSRLRYRQISLGWKHYFKGGYDAEMTWNLYGLAGFGLLLGRAVNSYSQPIDTVKYSSPLHPTSGTGDFKRLTFDIGLGTEIPLGSTIYLYTELRSWLPTSDYPSTYLINNNHLPLTLLLNGGIRVLID